MSHNIKYMLHERIQLHIGQMCVRTRSYEVYAKKVNLNELCAAFLFNYKNVEILRGGNASRAAM